MLHFLWQGLNRIHSSNFCSWHEHRVWECSACWQQVEYSPLTGSVPPTGTQKSGRVTGQAPTLFPPADLGLAGPWSRAPSLCPAHLSPPGAEILLLEPSCHWSPAVTQGLSTRSSAGHDCECGIMGKPVSPTPAAIISLSARSHPSLQTDRLWNQILSQLLPFGSSFVTSAS